MKRLGTKSSENQGMAKTVYTLCQWIILMQPIEPEKNQRSPSDHNYFVLLLQYFC